jgi:hypothetical protein
MGGRVKEGRRNIASYQFDFSFSLSLFFSYVQICVREHFLFYLFSACV